LTPIYVSVINKLIIMGHDGPVTMWEHLDEPCLKAEIRMVELCQNIGTGAEQPAPLRHALVGEAGFVEW
jgi:hypothetical protein